MSANKICYLNKHHEKGFIGNTTFYVSSKMRILVIKNNVLFFCYFFFLTFFSQYKETK